MGRKPHPGGCVRKSFSFSSRVASIIYRFASERTVSQTHFVTMAVLQYRAMLVCGAWSCPGSAELLTSCNHLNSYTAPSCERCGADSPTVKKLAAKKSAEKLLAKNAIPIKDVSHD